jgi:hypothetical protein
VEVTKFAQPKKAWQVHSSVNTKLISVFDVEGMVHRVCVPPGKTVNEQFYLNVLKRLCESLR